jgi:nucleoside-diphosphate-sugar epimerase
MNLLVVGANGFVGRALCTHMSRKGLSPYGLLRKTQENLDVKKQFIVEDFLNHSDWGSILKGMDGVIHTAGLAHANGRPEKDYYDVNTELTKKLALECVKAGVKRFVFISSISVYGISSSQNIVTLSTPLHPIIPYGLSKLLAENFLKELHKQGVLEVVVIRPPLIYGANAPGNINFLLKAIKCNVPMPFARVKNLRSLLHVENLCDCLINCAINPKAPGNTFLVSDAADISITSLIQHLAKGLNKYPKLFPFPFNLIYYILKIAGKEETLEKLTGSLQLDISHIQKTLGWKPVVSVQEGLEATAYSFSKHFLRM